MKSASGFENQQSSFGTPSLALKLGYSIRTCADIVLSNALKEGKAQEVKKAEQFIVLMKSDWSNEISSFALNTLYGQKYNKAKPIPLAKDLKKLYDSLNDKARKAKEDLKTQPSPESWRVLAEVTLAQISLFNRRRGGETQRMESTQ